MQATVASIGKLRIFNVDAAPEPSCATDAVRVNASPTKKTKQVHLTFLVDNSGSMGSATKTATNIFLSLVSNNTSTTSSALEIRGTLILFDCEVTIAAENFADGSDVARKLIFPTQGRTNITAGVTAAITSIARRRATNTSATEVHEIVIFLSDGAHNEGPVLTEDHLRKLSQRIAPCVRNLSFLVVGVDSNDTRLGMLAKTILETTPLSSELDLVHYAKDTNSMQAVLESLKAALMNGVFADGGGDTLCIELPPEHKTRFIGTMSTTVQLFVSNENKGKTISLAAAATTASDTNTFIVVNGQRVPVREVMPTSASISAAIAALAPQLAMARVAFGDADKNLKERIAFIDEHLTLAEDVLTAAATATCATAAATAIGPQPIPAAERQRLLKLARTSRQRFAEERNMLAQLSAKLSDNSQSAAQFLNGASRKFAGKALSRSTVAVAGETTGKDVIAQLRRDTLPALKHAVELDRLLERQRGATADPAALSQLSLQSTLETAQDWIALLEGDSSELEAGDIYDLLVSFSMLGVPVQFAPCAAAQMQPLMTRVSRLETATVDTGSIFLARQGGAGRAPRGQNGTPIEMVLPLVDPASPNSSAVMCRSIVGQLVASANITASLFMSHPQQQLASHAHAFAFAAQQFCGSPQHSSAYAELAVRIVFSYKRLTASATAAARRSGNSTALNDTLAAWFVRECSVTTADDSPDTNVKVDNPIVLPFLLAVADLSVDEDDTSAACADVKIARAKVLEPNAMARRQPFITAINEFLARRVKPTLSRIAAGSSKYSTSVAGGGDAATSTSYSPSVCVAHDLLRGYFCITKTNSPQPTEDVLANEPAMEAVMEAACPFSDVRNFAALGQALLLSAESAAITSVQQLVIDWCKPIHRPLQFATALQRGVTSEGRSVMQHMISAGSGAVPSQLVAAIRSDISASFSDDFLDGMCSSTIKSRAATGATAAASSSSSSSDKKSNGRATILNGYDAMLAQAMMFHDSASRKDIIMHDVVDDPVTLQEMIRALRMVCYFDSMQVKRQQYLAVIGNVSYVEALSADASRFASLLGGHTHGLCRQRFWSYLRSCDDDDRARVFREMSNHTLKGDAQFKAALARAKRRQF